MKATYFWVVVSILLVGLFLSFSGENSDKLLSIGDCVRQEAQENGYRGGAEDEWRLFSEICSEKIKSVK